MDELEALIRELIVDVRAQRRELRQLRRTVARLAPPRDDTALVMAIATAVQGRIFSAAELLHHAEHVDRALAAMFDTAALTTPHALGLWLHAQDGRAVAGVRLVRHSRDKRGVVWTVIGDADTQLHSDAGAAPRAGR